MTLAIVCSVLGVFWLVGAAKAYLDAPEWLWLLLTLGLGIGSIALWEGIQVWYAGFAVAGGTSLLQQVADILTVKSDALLKQVLQRR